MPGVYLDECFARSPSHAEAPTVIIGASEMGLQSA